MLVLIIGGGRTGAQLARMLLEQNHVVRIIENRKEILGRIHRELPTEVIFEGNPIDPQSLLYAGIESAQVLAAVTTSDETNLCLCYYARERFKVPRTIARVNNPANAWLFDGKFHVDAAVNQAAMMARLIEEEISVGDMMVLMKLRRGNYSLVEEKIQDGAKAVGIEIKDLALPEHCVIAAIIRQGEVIVPRGITAIQPGDEILAVTDSDGADELANLFSPPVPSSTD